MYLWSDIIIIHPETQALLVRSLVPSAVYYEKHASVCTQYKLEILTIKKEEVHILMMLRCLTWEYGRIQLRECAHTSVLGLWMSL